MAQVCAFLIPAVHHLIVVILLQALGAVIQVYRVLGGTAAALRLVTNQGLVAAVQA